MGPNLPFSVVGDRYNKSKVGESRGGCSAGSMPLHMIRTVTTLVQAGQCHITGKIRTDTILDLRDIDIYIYVYRCSQMQTGGSASVNTYKNVSPRTSVCHTSGMSRSSRCVFY